MWRYARGEAAARRGDAAAVKAEAALVKASPDALAKFGDSRPMAQAMVDVARLVLTGRAAMLEKRYADAEAAYRRAADLQDARLGRLRDPPAWWYPVRRSLAAALLAEGQPDRAITQAREAMARWPHDPLASRIVSDGQAALGQDEAARAQMAAARANWSGDLAAMPAALL